jgi:hypothetical protein
MSAPLTNAFSSGTKTDPRFTAQPASAAPAVSDDSLMNSRLFIFISLFPALAVMPIVSYLTDTHKQNLGFKD